MDTTLSKWRLLDRRYFDSQPVGLLLVMFVEYMEGVAIMRRTIRVELAKVALFGTRLGGNVLPRKYATAIRDVNRDCNGSAIHNHLPGRGGRAAAGALNVEDAHLLFKCASC